MFSFNETIDNLIIRDKLMMQRDFHLHHRDEILNGREEENNFLLFFFWKLFEKKHFSLRDEEDISLC